MRRFFISPEQMKQRMPSITGSDAHHLKSVLRLKAGDRIVVFDGQGQEYEARIEVVEPDKAAVSLLSPLTASAESPLELTLAQGYLKDKKMDLLVRPLTEIGVNGWMPFQAKRSVSVPDKMRLQARYQRWQKLSQEAVKQCGRSRMMRIEPAWSLEAVLEHARDYDLKLVFYENAPSKSLSDYGNQGPAKVFILVGPEGGFKAAEVADAEAMGFRVVGMGPRILRAETAALAACTLVQYIYGDLG